MNQANALGFVLYHDTPMLAQTPIVQELLRRQNANGTSLEAALDYMTPFAMDDTRKAKRKKANLSAGLKTAASGKLFNLVLSTNTRTPPSHRVEITFDCATEEVAREEAFDPWLYTFVMIVGDGLMTPEEVVGFACELAEKTNAKAGIVASAESFNGLVAYLLWSPGDDSLTPAQRARLASQDRETFGTSPRGPEWGTFLSASQVQRLGGTQVLKDCGSVARVAGLASGGAYVQVTDTPEGFESQEGLERLAELQRLLQAIVSTS